MSKPGQALQDRGGRPALVPTAMTCTLWAAIVMASPLAARERLQCSIEIQAAEAILRLRDQGQSKDFVLAPLPPRQTTFKAKSAGLQARLAVQMYSIIDDLYANPDLKAGAYLSYRELACRQRNGGLKAPASLREVAVPVFACQEKYGNTASAQMRACLEEVFAYYTAHGH